MRTIILLLENLRRSSINILMNIGVRGADLDLPESILECSILSLKLPALLLPCLGLLLDFLDLSILDLHLLDKFPPLVIVAPLFIVRIPELFLEHGYLVCLPLDQVLETLQLTDLVALVRIVAVHQILQLTTQLLQLLAELVVFLK
jgi:hypothetical protein